MLLSPSLSHTQAHTHTYTLLSVHWGVADDRAANVGVTASAEEGKSIDGDENGRGQMEKEK